jgi:hypothetical protein
MPSTFEKDLYEYHLVDLHPTVFQRKKGRNQHIPAKHRTINVKEHLKIIREFKTGISRDPPKGKHHDIPKKPLEKVNKKIVGQV